MRASWRSSGNHQRASLRGEATCCGAAFVLERCGFSRQIRRPTSGSPRAGYGKAAGPDGGPCGTSSPRCAPGKAHGTNCVPRLPASPASRQTQNDGAEQSPRHKVRAEARSCQLHGIGRQETVTRGWAARAQSVRKAHQFNPVVFVVVGDLHERKWIRLSSGVVTFAKLEADVEPVAVKHSAGGSFFP